MRLCLPLTVNFCYILLIGALPALAQVDCPAMAITRPKANHKRIMGGFSDGRSSAGRQGQMGDFFTSRTRGPSKVNEHSEFSTRSGRTRFFRDFDEFTTKRQGRSGYRDFDEFSRRGRQGRFRDFDEFTRRGDRQSEANRRGGAGSASKGFHRRARRVNSQDSRESRGQRNRKDYTPFSTSVSPNAGEVKHREPEMGLWGGTIGSRGAEKKRKMVPFPDEEKKDE